MTLPLGSANTSLFIKSEDTSLMYELWDGYSGFPGLLDAAPIGSRKRAGYKYDPSTGKFYRVGSKAVITETQLRTAVKRVSDQAALRMRKETQQLIAGAVLLTVWYTGMRSLMNALYRTIFTLSIGGFAFEDEAARNLFYVLVLSQFSWLDNFAAQVKSGAQVLNGSALTRAGMYGTYGNGFHQNIKLYNAQANGYSEARRILGPAEDHCQDDGIRQGCQELARKGWISLGDMVPIGDATCYSNCLCRILYR